MIRLFRYIIPVLLLLPCGLHAQQGVRARVAGLEGDSLYMSLLGKVQQLTSRTDSLSAVMDRMRAQWRTDSASRQSISARILEDEQQLFALRGQIGQLSERINAIEQQWIVMHLKDSDGHDAEHGHEHEASGPGVANLVMNDALRDNLKPDDYAALLAAQRMEPQAASLARLYGSQLAGLRQLSRQYDTVTKEAAAQLIMEQFDSLRTLSRATEDSLTACYTRIFDNKTYAYSYIADKNNHSDLIAEFNKALSDMRREQSAAAGLWASDALTGYWFSKRAVGYMERHIADLFSLRMAADSLSAAAVGMKEQDFFLEPVTLSERLFLDYEPLSVHTPSIYSSRNPIPECRVYTRGTIYRIELGRFSSAQSPSIFRGVAPLSYLREDGRYVYFAGGFASDSTAFKAQADLKAMGFRRPEVVVWVDGVYTNLSRSQASMQSADTVLMRITISGLSAVDDELRTEIAAVSDRFDIMRSGNAFVIAPVEGRGRAERIREIIRRLRPQAVAELSEMK